MTFGRILILVILLISVPMSALVVDRHFLDLFITSKLFPAKVTVALAPSENLGSIYVDSPEIYTRERLVNDRYQEDAWLQGRLELTDDLDFGIQGVRDVRAATQLIARMNVGVTLPNAVGAPSNATTPSADNAATIDDDDDPPRRPAASPTKPLTPKDRSPIDDFRDRAAYREEIRSAIIENQLDDRHDIDGNTLYRLKFDATIIPSANIPHWAKIEVAVKPRLHGGALPDGYGMNWSMGRKALFLQKEWGQNEKWDAEQWRQVFNTYLSRVSQVLTSRLEGRIEALREIVDGTGNLESLGIETRQDLRNLPQKIEQALRDIIIGNDDLAGEAKAKAIIDRCRKIRKSGLNFSAVNIETIKSLECMLFALERENSSDWGGGFVSSETFLNRQIASVIWPSLNAAFERNRNKSRPMRGRSGSRTYGATTPIERLSLDEFGQVVLADPNEFVGILFDIYEHWVDGESEAFGVPESALDDDDLLFCRDTHPKIFAAVEAALSSIGHTLSDFQTPEIMGLRSYEISIDEEEQTLKCFDTFLEYYRSDGFIVFLESFKDHSEPPAYSYAITPKESVQRLSDTFNRRSATSALAAVALSVPIVRGESSIAFDRDLQKNLSGISRYPLVVGYSRPIDDKDIEEEGGAALRFGWVIAPRWNPGHDETAPEFRQVLTQQGLSAVISVPAWWPSVNIEIVTSWLNQTDTIPLNSPPRPTMSYGDVRLPGDLDEILRVLYPNLNKAPKIDRFRMQMVNLRLSGRSKPRNPPMANAKTPAASGAVAPVEGEAAVARNRTVHLVIPGHNLWRSTIVTLGAERAQQIWVMPNMRGIIAEFARVPDPHRGEPVTIPLRVWTSEGVDVVRNKVCVIPHDAPPIESCDPPEPDSVDSGDAGARLAAQGFEPTIATGPPRDPTASEPSESQAATPQLAALGETISFFASSDGGTAIVPDVDGLARITIRSQDLVQLKNQDLDVKIGLVAEKVSGELKILGMKEINDLIANLDADSLMTEIDLPRQGEGLGALENGAKTQLVLRLSDPDGNVYLVYSSNSLVYYADADKAKIRFVSNDLVLNSDTLRGVFEIVFPARMFDAFPGTFEADILLYARLENVGGEATIMEADFEPLTDMDMEEFTEQREIRAPFSFELSPDDGKILEDHFQSQDPAPIVFVFKYDQPDIAGMPKLSGTISVTGIAEAMKKK